MSLLLARNLTVIACLVAAVCAVDRPELASFIVICTLCAWIFPAIWKISEIRVEL